MTSQRSVGVESTVPPSFTMWLGRPSSVMGLLIVATLLIAGCAESDERRIVGIWELDTEASQAATLALPQDEPEGDPAEVIDMLASVRSVLGIFADGTAVMSILDRGHFEAMAATWTLNGNDFLLIENAQDGQYTFAGRLDGDDLLLAMGEDAIFAFRKQSGATSHTEDFPGRLLAAATATRAKPAEALWPATVEEWKGSSVEARATSVLAMLHGMYRNLWAEAFPNGEPKPADLLALNRQLCDLLEAHFALHTVTMDVLIEAANAAEFRVWSADFDARMGSARRALDAEYEHLTGERPAETDEQTVPEGEQPTDAPTPPSLKDNWTLLFEGLILSTWDQALDTAFVRVVQRVVAAWEQH
jgi:hypothetical protein